jgi:hypothetical protein
MILVVIVMVAVGIAYSAMNGLTAQPSPNTTSCKTENLAGNFTSSSPMNSGTGPYNGTVYLQNAGSQSVAIANYTDQNGLTQSVNWLVPSSSTESFSATLSRAESSLVVETSCGNSFTFLVYYPSSPDQSKHYEVALFVSLGNTAQ